MPISAVPRQWGRPSFFVVRPTSNSKRGGALLAVLWLSVALSAIAFSVANSVRGETERTSTAAEESQPPSSSSFQARHASLEELEEILLVPGMTPAIFYARFDRDPSGRL